MLHGNLRICPSMPDNWKKLDFYIFWHGQKLHVKMDHENLWIVNETGTEEIEIEVYGEKCQLTDKISMKYAAGA